MARKLNNGIMNYFKKNGKSKKNKKNGANKVYKATNVEKKQEKIERFYEFERLCQKSQRKMKNYLYEELKKSYDTVIKEDVEDGYVFALGEVPVMLLAHMDTVHKELPREFVYKEHSNVISSPQGIGGDDRCGIYMILQIIKELKCSVLFLNNEEIGCRGASTFAKDFKAKKHKAFEDLNINYMIEFDRRGSNDAVYYDLDNQDFEDFITDASNGHFETNWGSCSDISYVAPVVGVAAVNLSCGYYNEHTLIHTVNRKEMETNIEKAKLIIKTEVEKPFEYKEDTRWKAELFGKGYGSKYKYYWDDDYDYNYGYGYNGYSTYPTNTKATKKDELSPKELDLMLEEYEIYFLDEDGTEAVDYFFASSTYEALGKFVEAHPYIRYQEIYSVAETFDTDYSTADRYYYEGAEEKINDWEVKA